MARGSSTEIGPHKRRVRPDAGQTPGSGRRAAEKALADLIRAEEKIKQQRADTLRDFIKSWLEWKEPSISPKTVSVYESSLKRIPETMWALPFLTG